MSRIDLPHINIHDKILFTIIFPIVIPFVTNRLLTAAETILQPPMKVVRSAAQN
jgi:hypothetical protein